MNVLNRLSSWLDPHHAEPVAGPIPVAKLATLNRQESIGYSPQLITRLCADHGVLLTMYQSLTDLLSQRQYEAVGAALGTFKSKFDVHILNENLRLYCYLEQKLEGQPEALARTKSLRKDINGLARGFVSFVRKYRTAGVCAENHRGFESELRMIGTLLMQRIEQEEHDLYPLYTR